jgi:hypothetical protein
MLNERVFSEGIDVVAKAHDWLRLSGVYEIDEDIGSLDLITPFKEVVIVMSVGIELVSKFAISLLFCEAI